MPSRPIQVTCAFFMVRQLLGACWRPLELQNLSDMLDTASAARIQKTICRYGPLPSAKDLDLSRLIARLGSDKKTLKGQVHFVLPAKIGDVKVVAGIPDSLIRRAITESLQ